MLFSGVALRTFIVHLLFDFKSNMFEVQSIQYEVYVADLDFVRVCFFTSCPVFVCPLCFFPYLFHLFVVPQFKKYICSVYPQFIFPFKYYNSNLTLL